MRKYSCVQACPRHERIYIKKYIRSLSKTNKEKYSQEKNADDTHCKRINNHSYNNKCIYSLTTEIQEN